MPQPPVHRVEVRSRPEFPDPRGQQALSEAKALGLEHLPERIEHAAVYLISAPLSDVQLSRLSRELLADPITQTAITDATRSAENRSPAVSTVEIHHLPGVMDPSAQSVELAIRSLLGIVAEVRTGRRYDLHNTDPSTARVIARQCLANPVIHAIHEQPYHPDGFPIGTPQPIKVKDIAIRDRDEPALKKLSREGHLFLSLEEMKAIQSEYRRLGREPREIELETLAQTWSEHCVHKTLKATVRYREETSGNTRPGMTIPGLAQSALQDRPGHERNADGSITIHNLLNSTVAAATRELIDEGIDWCLSVFVDNAGIIAFDDDHAVCFKVETHNHPSALEPYGGAATGIGGCIRDIIGTGRAARPIAATDVFCVAHPDHYQGRGFTTEFTESHGEENRKQKTESRNDQTENRRQMTEESAHTSSSFNPSSISSSSPWPSVNSVVKSLPEGCLHPRRILSQVVAGVRDYGNRMGIATLNGAVWFDDDYLGNPLVFCGCVGVMPRDRIGGEPQPGDRIIALGGRTGRDGIHGATFSSAELTDTHSDEFSHAVQIGNPVTQKKMLDAILEARGNGSPAHRAGSDSGTPDLRTGCDKKRNEHSSSQGQQKKTSGSESRAPTCLFNAITDCGAGGFSSAVGEMCEHLGAEVNLENAPLKYDGLTPTEIWISEAQERMVLAVPADNITALQQICDKHEVELCDLGCIGTENRELILRYKGEEFGRLSMDFLHNGLPVVVREAVWAGESPQPKQGTANARPTPSLEEALLRLLAHPNIASKRWIIRQYDHEVQGRSVIKPLVGFAGEGPSDASVILPVEGSARGLAIANGLATGLSDDPYVMALAAIDECVRNFVCVGADPSRIAILDNFCWPGCDDPQKLAALVRAAEGCYDAAKAYETPFISGKDSLNNQFTTESGETIAIAPTLLISGFGIVPDVTKCVTMDAKRAGNLLCVVGMTNHHRMRGSHYDMIFGDGEQSEMPVVELEYGPEIARSIHRLIDAGLIESAHDCSEGGILVAAAEMAMAGGLGLNLDFFAKATASRNDTLLKKLTCEEPSRYLLEITDQAYEKIGREYEASTDYFGVMPIGKFDDTGRVSLSRMNLDISIDDLLAAWTGTLDW